ncbi:MAG: hypothetical protein MUE40_03630 [Anaerolineae bacterium]|jgi:hypothetical protein|nr:hypothetical protein [Anaerolineae bacterium]
MTRGWLCLLLLLAGCLPVTAPPQLQHTPGAFVRVDERRLTAPGFQVQYPPGWRIVRTSIAADPVQVVFVAPDEALTITLSRVPLPAGAARRTTRTLADGTRLYLAGQYPPARAADFEAAWRAVLQSLAAAP